VADDGVNRLGAMLEELGARFELVVEAVSGFGGRLDALRDEIFGQFAEVGGQIRFLSEQIAENRRSIIISREDLGAEIIRVGEALGKARVEFREELSNSGKELRTELHDQLSNSAKELRTELHDQLSGSAKELREEIGSSVGLLREEMNISTSTLRSEIKSSAKELRDEMKSSAKDLREEMGKSSRELRAEIKQTNKSLANLAQKFDRFDDRITVQTRDQDQRLKKMEKKRAS
jgi:gas vesicle protein